MSPLNFLFCHLGDGDNATEEDQKAEDAENGRKEDDAEVANKPEETEKSEEA